MSDDDSISSSLDGHSDSGDLYDDMRKCPTCGSGCEYNHYGRLCDTIVPCTENHDNGTAKHANITRIERAVEKYDPYCETMYIYGGYGFTVESYEFPDGKRKAAVWHMSWREKAIVISNFISSMTINGVFYALWEGDSGETNVTTIFATSDVSVIEIDVDKLECPENSTDVTNHYGELYHFPRGCVSLKVNVDHSIIIVNGSKIRDELIKLAWNEIVDDIPWTDDNPSGTLVYHWMPKPNHYVICDYGRVLVIYGGEYPHMFSQFDFPGLTKYRILLNVKAHTIYQRTWACAEFSLYIDRSDYLQQLDRCRSTLYIPGSCMQNPTITFKIPSTPQQFGPDHYNKRDMHDGYKGWFVDDLEESDCVGVMDDGMTRFMYFRTDDSGREIRRLGPAIRPIRNCTITLHLDRTPWTQQLYNDVNTLFTMMPNDVLGVIESYVNPPEVTACERKGPDGIDDVITNISLVPLSLTC